MNRPVWLSLLSLVSLTACFEPPVEPVAPRRAVIVHERPVVVERERYVYECSRAQYRRGHCPGNYYRY